MLPTRMARCRRAIPALLAMLAVATGCTSQPATVLVHVSAGPGVGALEELRLTVFEEPGIGKIRDRRVPATGAPELPGDLVLYPYGATGELRILMRGRAGGKAVAEGTTTATLRAEEQVEAKLMLVAGRLPDADGDGVPDTIDSCPRPNPDQRACAGGDGGGDAGDGPRPDAPLPCVKASDCDDKDVCTVDSCSPAGTCRREAIACPAGGKPCEEASCDPLTGCTTITSKDGATCDDGLFCTDGDSCQAGTCSGQARDCSAGAPVCKAASCDEAKDACVYTAAADGTTCDDKDPCTQGDSCKAGKCVDPGPQIETIEQVDLYYGSDRYVAVDSKGAVHAIYYDVDNKNLRHARRSAGGVWTVKVAAKPSAGKDTGRFPALAVDASDTLHAVYLDGESKNMVHAASSSGGASWTATTIGPGDGHSSIAVKGNGTIHVSFRRQKALYHGSRKAGGAWKLTKVDETPTTSSDVAGVMSSIAVSGGKMPISQTK